MAREMRAALSRPSSHACTIRQRARARAHAATRHGMVQRSFIAGTAPGATPTECAWQQEHAGRRHPGARGPGACRCMPASQNQRHTAGHQRTLLREIECASPKHRSRKFGRTIPLVDPCFKVRRQIFTVRASTTLASARGPAAHGLQRPRATDQPKGILKTS
jgi:hypothetical protein